jgi:hypothetical protein
VISSRLALSLLSVSKKEYGNAICSFVEKWYGDDGQWKSAFGSALQIAVGTIIFTHLKLHYVYRSRRRTGRP